VEVYITEVVARGFDSVALLILLSMSSLHRTASFSILVHALLLKNHNNHMFNMNTGHYYNLKSYRYDIRII